MLMAAGLVGERPISQKVWVGNGLIILTGMKLLVLDFFLIQVVMICHAARAMSYLDRCTLVTKGTSPVAQKGNMSHAFLCMIDADNSCHRMRCHREYLNILAVVSGLILCTTLLVVIWLLIYRRSNKRTKSRILSNPASLALVSPSWKVYTCDEWKSIMKNFSDTRLLGDAKTWGTYGGVLPDGSKVVVKKLKRSGLQRKKEFYYEIGRVAKLNHPNLVALKGCCYDHSD